MCKLKNRERKERREGRRFAPETVTPDPGCGDWLTVGRGGPQLTGRLCHVLSQQFPVGDPRGHLPVQLLIQELLHSGTCGETAAKATGLLGRSPRMKAVVTETDPDQGLPTGVPSLVTSRILSC